MKQRGALFMIGLAVLILLAVIMLMVSGNRKERFDWRHTYLPNSKQPYGTAVLYQLLQKHFPEHGLKQMNQNPAEWLPGADTDGHAVYFFIGFSPFLSQTGMETLHEFVSRGNQAIILAADPNAFWLSRLEPDKCNLRSAHKYFITDLVKSNFLYGEVIRDEDFHFAHRAKGDTTSVFWSAFRNREENCYDEATYFPLGSIQDSLLNFLAFRIGEGTVFVHSTPLLLTNLYLATEEGKTYAERVLAYLEPGRIYWDNFSYVPSIHSGQQSPYSSGTPQTPMSFILSQPPLLWAWYVLLAATLLYVLVRSKRMQRIIPVVLPPGHTALEFARAVGELYFRQQDHFSVMQKQMDQWKQYLWRQYRIHPDKAVMEASGMVAQRTGVPQILIDRIFDQHNLSVRFEGANAKELLEFNQKLHAFYEKAK